MGEQINYLGIVATACQPTASCLACRMGKIYKFLGLTVSVIKSADDPNCRAPLYKCDVMYLTAQTLCFSYLTDNTAHFKHQVVGFLLWLFDFSTCSSITNAVKYVK